MKSNSCSIGDQPLYTVNATEVADVVAGVNFAREHNVRLVIRNTGHDILRRFAVCLDCRLCRV